MTRRTITIAITFAGLGVAAACGGPSGGEDPFATGAAAEGTAAGDPSTTADAGSDAGPSPTTDAADTSGVGDGGPKLDVGAEGSDGAGEAGTCVGEACSCTAVDLLFVIDNSTSMSDLQVALAAAFPSFADAIIAALPPGTNLHVAVTSTEMGDSNAGSTINCEATGNGLPQESFYVTPDVMNTGTNGAQGRLYEAAGLSYFEIDTDAGPAEVQALRDWFAAAAQIGEGGSNIEMSAAAAGWATDPANAATNAGFLRDEGAVLVLFFLQDEPDQTDAPGLSMAETGQAMLDKIAAAKVGCGGLQCVVAGGFVQQGCLAENALGVVLGGVSQPPSLGELPFFDEDITPEYFEPLLADTPTQVIAQTCDDIGPEG